MPPTHKKQPQQIQIFPTKLQTQHGGEFSRGRRKLKRPISCQKSLHVVLRSDKAKGYRSLNNNTKMIHALTQKTEKHFGVKVYGFALNHNHLHLSVRGKRIIDIQNFFRVLAGHMAQQILRKFPLPQIAGNAPNSTPDTASSKSKYKRKFWNDLIYSRLVTWGREFRQVLAYIEKNKLEALGLLPQRTRTASMESTLKSKSLRKRSSA